LRFGSAADAPASHPTGVLARWRSDGVLQYLGELANTAYADGHRLDLDAIQARLDRHPQVARSLAIVRPDRNGHASLAVYVVPKNGGPTAAAMQSQLRGVVPETLLPRHCPELAAIPTLANGEVNVAALPHATDSDTEVITLHASASTTTEIVLADIWRTLLKVDRVDTTDNFFDLGGHSLLAMSVAAEIKSRLGAELNLRQLIFESLGQIAASLEQQAPAEAVPAAAPERKGWLQTLVARMWS
jgi:acyl carrier protein